MFTMLCPAKKQVRDISAVGVKATAKYQVKLEDSKGGPPSRSSSSKQIYSDENTRDIYGPTFYWKWRIHHPERINSHRT